MASPSSNTSPQAPLPMSSDDEDPNPDTTNPYEGLPELAEGMVWSAFPWNSQWLSDTAWFDQLGNDQMAQRRIFASRSKSEQVAAALTLFEEFPKRGLDIMFKAAVKGKAHVIAALLDAGVKGYPTPGENGEFNEGMGGPDDRTLVPLQAAAFNGNLECVEVLIGKGSMDVDYRDELDGTPLMRACAGQHPEIVKWLLERGADPTIRQIPDPSAKSSDEQNVGVNALEFAAGSGCLECAKLLLEWRPQETSKEENIESVEEIKVKVTPICLEGAVNSMRIDLLQFLLEKGGYPTEDVDENGVWKGEKLTDEQRYSIQKGLRSVCDLPSLYLLLSYLQRPNRYPLSQPPSQGFDYEYMDLPNDVREGIMSAIKVAAMKGNEGYNPEIFKLLWHVALSSPELTELHFEGQTFPKSKFVNYLLLHEAAKADSVEVMKFLLQMPETDINVPGLKKVGHLYRAAIDQKLEAVRCILEHSKPDIHQGNGLYANGGTALFGAVMGGNADIVKLLLQHGGPLESPIDGGLRTKEPKKVVIRAVQGYRAPVTMELWTETSSERREKTFVVVLDLDETDVEWLAALEVRKSDEDLIVNDRGERELKPKD